MRGQLSKRGGRRPGAGRKPRSAAEQVALRLRVEAALVSPQAGELFALARHGDVAAARALRSLFETAARLGFMTAEREAATGRDFFWWRGERQPNRSPAADLFADVAVLSAANGERRS